MREITKDQFLDKFQSGFVGDSSRGYIYNDVFIAESQLSTLSEGYICSLEDLEKLLEDFKNGVDEDAYTDLNNAIMAYIFGDGTNYIGSFEETAGSKFYCWCLDFGSFQIDLNKSGFYYREVKLYKDQ